MRWIACAGALKPALLFCMALTKNSLQARTTGESMFEKKNDELLHDHNHDGIDRRGFLKCMAWAGTGALCVMEGGILKSYSLSCLSQMDKAGMKGELSFVQISDS